MNTFNITIKKKCLLKPFTFSLINRSFDIIMDGGYFEDPTGSRIVWTERDRERREKRIGSLYERKREREREREKSFVYV